MDVYFTPEQESQLVEIARHHRRADAGQLLQETALRLVDEDARFPAAVLEGKEYADRGEFIEEDEMDARFEQMLRS